MNADPKYDLRSYYGRRMVKEFLCRLQNNKCIYCLEPVDVKSVTIDHVVPRWRHGSDEIGNLVGACLRCNEEKGDKTLYEFAPWLADAVAEIAEAEAKKPKPARRKQRAALNDAFAGLATMMSARQMQGLEIEDALLCAIMGPSVPNRGTNPRLWRWPYKDNWLRVWKKDGGPWICWNDDGESDEPMQYVNFDDVLQWLNRHSS